MLQAMRTGKGSRLIKYFVFGLLILGMLGLVFMDPNNMVRFKGAANQAIVTSKIEDISTMTFDTQLRNSLRQTDLSLEQALSVGFAQQVLAQLTSRSVFNQAAIDANIIPDDVSAANEIRSLLSQLTAQGLSEKEALARLLEAQNMTEEMLVSAIKSDLKIRFLLESLAKAGVVAPQMVDAVYAFSKEKRGAAYVTLTADSLPAIPAPTDALLETYYNENLKEKMRLPEFRSFEYSVLPLTHFKQNPITVSDDELKAIYAERQNEYQTPKQILVEQVMVSTQQVAGAVLKAVQDGQSFADAVKTHGGTDAIYMPKAPFDDGAAEAKVAETVKSLQTPSLSPVIETPLGFYVVNVVEIKPAVSKAFDEIKDELRQKIQTEKASDKLYETATKIEQRLNQGEALSTLTQAYKLTAPIQTATFTAMGMTKDNTLASDVFGQGDEGLKIAQSLFDLPAGKGRILELQKGDFLLVSVKNIIPSETKAFADVKETVKAMYLSEQKRDALKTQSDKIITALRDGQKTFADVARENNLTLKSTALLTRASETAKDLPPSFIPSLFNISNDKDAVSAASADSLSITILMLKNKERIDQNAINRQSDEYKQLALALENDAQNKMIEAFKAHLLNRYQFKIDDQALSAYLKTLEKQE